MSTVRPLRPRLVIRVGKDRSFQFAATTDVEVIIVREGFGRFRALPTVMVGIEHVRRLLLGQRLGAARALFARRESAT